MNNYTRERSKFFEYLVYIEANPQHGFEFDDFLLEWKVGTDMPPEMKPPSKDQFSHCLAGLEKALPFLKNDLVCARASLAAWRVMFRPNHHPAMTPRWAKVLVLGGLRLAGFWNPHCCLSKVRVAFGQAKLLAFVGRILSRRNLTLSSDDAG